MQVTAASRRGSIRVPLDRNVQLGEVPQHKVDHLLQLIVGEVAADRLQRASGAKRTQRTAAPARPPQQRKASSLLDPVFASEQNPVGVRFWGSKIAKNKYQAGIQLRCLFILGSLEHSGVIFGFHAEKLDI